MDRERKGFSRENDPSARGSALLLIDVQNDFCPGGALPVPEGDAVVPVLNEYIGEARAAGMPIYASRDWHPRVTTHFKEWGGPWPPHCVQGTEGAELHPDLQLPDDLVLVSTGMDPTDQGYSAFEAVDPAGKPLAESLRAKGVNRVFVGGLATDYCVRASVLDARKHGFDTVVLLDAIRGLDVEPGDVERALREMRDAGAKLEGHVDLATAASGEHGGEA